MFIKEKERIYMKGEDDRILAEVTFPEIESGVYDINRTFVDDSLRGQGMANKLVTEAVNQIRSGGNTVSASCSYAIKWLEEEDK